MPLLLLFLKNNIKEILIVIIVASLAYSGYHYVWNRGYADATTEWSQKFKEQADERNARIEELTGYARSNLEQSIINSKKVQDELAIIKRNSKGRPTTVVVGKDCNPSKEFIETYNNAIKRGNEK